MHPLQTAERYWQTLRWLRPVQFYGRLSFRLARPHIDASPAPKRRQISGPWVKPAQRKPSLTGSGQFSFLNESGELASCGWDDSAREKLWRYNQHYFDDLNAAGAASRQAWHRALLQDWLTNNPPGQGTAWEPYPTSLRIVNWIKWALDGNALDQPLQDSLAMQARWLAKRLEWHLLGNHLFANAKALVFAGLWFDGEEARDWRDKGLGILARETAEQILSDGGQFELSPMYHALALEDLLDLVNVTRCYATALSPDQWRQSADWAARIRSMRRWLAALSHPDGKIAFFNDAAFAVAPDNSELETYATNLDFEGISELDELTWLADSGYARLSQANAVLIADMARVGPDYLPGHAHADTLSFEFSLFGQRLLVNSGTSVYGTGAERLRQRGTAAHNTVTVSGRNSSDVWSGFRVGRRASPIDPRVARESEALIAEAAHDGYRYLPGHPLHRRRWQLSPNALRIEDTVSALPLKAEARFHLHPDVRIDQSEPDGGSCTLPSGEIITWRANGGPVRLDPTTWHPEFGVSKQSTCLAVALHEGRATLDMRWA
jgi:uncharacterized heparinase superfamily protein